jgi:IS5 family transposase
VDKARLDQILNTAHALFKLANSINWSVFEQEFGPLLYAEEVGRPALSIRLVVGLHYLKHLYEVSDESVVERFLENPYWQYFCGLEYFEHEMPCHPTSLVKWRNRVGAERIEKLLKETVEVARREQVLKRSEVERVNIDTTVQEKAIAFPTDARLYYKARRALVRAAKALGIILRQSYERLSKRALERQGRYAHAGHSRQARGERRRLRVYLGRVIRDIKRKCENPNQELVGLLEIAERILNQKKEDKGKIYSVHAQEVECISKGKAHKRYEFGCKVRVATTSKRGWVVGIDAEHGNPYDGHMLEPAIRQVEQLTGVRPKQAFVDRGFKGTEKTVEGIEVYIWGRRGLSRTLKAMLKRRSGIEPIIGHMKHDHGMERNHLLGKAGDRINAMLSGCGFNLRKLVRTFSSVVSGRVMRLAA